MIKVNAQMAKLDTARKMQGISAFGKDRRELCWFLTEVAQQLDTAVVVSTRKRKVPALSGVWPMQTIEEFLNVPAQQLERRLGNGF